MGMRTLLARVPPAWPGAKPTSPCCRQVAATSSLPSSLSFSLSPPSPLSVHLLPAQRLTCPIPRFARPFSPSPASLASPLRVLILRYHHLLFPLPDPLTPPDDSDMRALKQRCLERQRVQHLVRRLVARRAGGGVGAGEPAASDGDEPLPPALFEQHVTMADFQSGAAGALGRLHGGRGCA